MFVKRHPLRSLGGMGLAVLSLVGLSMLATTPDSLGPVFITMWFIAVFIGFAFVLASIFAKISSLIDKGQRRHSLAFAFRRGVLVSLFFVSLLSLSSLHQLSLVDIVLVILLVAGVEFYFFRRSGISYE